MLKVRSLVAAAGALIALPLMGSPAWSAACVSAPVSDYTASGFSCTEGPFTFSNISVTTGLVIDDATVTFGNIAPFFIGNDFGLTLNLNANAMLPGAFARVFWNYTLTANPDAQAALLRTFGFQTSEDAILNNIMTVGTASVTASGPGEQDRSISFTPVGQAAVTNTGTVFSGAELTSIGNAFNPVPGPIVGAGLPGLVAALGGLIAMARRRRKQLA